MAVVISVPWSSQPWALPCLVVLTTSSVGSERLGKRHKILAMWAAQMMGLLHRWLLDRQICLLGDGADSVLALGVHASKREVAMITPMRLESVLRESAPPSEQRRKGGKPQMMGPRLPSLEQVPLDPETCWHAEFLCWYGQGKCRVQWCSGTAWWYRFSSPPLPIRWVLTCDPAGQRDPKALICTDQDLTTLDIMRSFMKRWPLETTFEESRA